MSFRVPESSSPPSTPDRHRRSHVTPHPSTTPAGPPPSSLTGFSTTPAGNPPASSFFGNRSNDFASSTLNFGSTNGHPIHSSPLRRQQLIHQEDDEDDEDDEDEEEDDVDAMDEDDALEGQLAVQPQSSSSDFDPAGDALNLREIARGLASTATQRATEPDSLILRTEGVLDDLFRAIEQDSSEQDRLLSSATQSLITIWEEIYPSSEYERTFGPTANEPTPKKAVYLASLLLQLHHSPVPTGLPQQHGSTHRQKDPIPKVILKWLKANHYPLKSEVQEVIGTSPNPASHHRFWDVVYNITLRGNLRDAYDLLRVADLGQAATAIDDGATERGYRGKQLSSAKYVMQHAVDVVGSCPALRNDNWNVEGAEWALFRKRVKQAISDLKAFAEGDNVDRYEDTESNFEASNFGMSNRVPKDLSITLRSRQAESKVPWTIYQNLQYLYDQLLGIPSEIVAAAADWMEAAVGMVAWWNGEDEDVPDANKNSNNRSGFSRSIPNDRYVDREPQLAYQRKLSSVVEDLQTGVYGEEDVEMQIDPTDSLQVGLGCVLIGEFEGLIQIIRGWSPTIAMAVIEIAELGRWLRHNRPSQELLDDLDQGDLMVLSYAQESNSVADHDTALSDYAETLARRSNFTNEGIERQGWQIAVEVLGRLHNSDVAAKKIGECLDQLEITNLEQVNQTVALCNKLGLKEHAQKISMRYGDYLAETTQLYGAAIHNYLRAGSVRKVQELLNLLISLSLVQSIAYPQEADLDPTMRNLISSPKQTIAKLAIFNIELQEQLLNHISGYAALRRFYDLRDYDTNKPRSAASVGPFARKKEALKLLMSLIQSASDSIHGGLFDNSVNTSIPVDGLLVLLGESLPFINHPKSLLSHGQAMSILKATEDASTTSSQIFEKAENCLKSAIGSSHGDTPPSLGSILKKSGSNMTGSMQFSLVGSDFLGQDKSHSSGSGSGVLVEGPVKRGWDWRKGIGRDTKGETILQILRLELAKEISRTWLRREDALPV